MSDGMSTTEFTSWCREILDDLDAATEQAASDTRKRAGGTRGEALVYGVGDEFTRGRGGVQELEKVQQELSGMAHVFQREPFIMRVAASRMMNGAVPEDCLFYVTRGQAPTGLALGRAKFVTAQSALGRMLREAAEPGEEQELRVGPRHYVFAVSHLAVVRPNEPDSGPRDASVHCDKLNKTGSARSWVGRCDDSDDLHDDDDQLSTPPADTPRHGDLEFHDAVRFYAEQRSVVEAPFGTPLLLHGPAGTGKTTALIKRVVQILVDVSDAAGESSESAEERGLSIAVKQGCPATQWAFLVPREDWVRYVQTAFRKEGTLTADARRVRTWDDLRSRELQRPDVLRGADDAAPALTATQTEEFVIGVVEEIDAEFRTAVVAALADLAVAGRMGWNGVQRPYDDHPAVDEIYQRAREVLASPDARRVHHRAAANFRALVDQLPSEARVPLAQVADERARSARNLNKHLRELALKVARGLVDDDDSDFMAAVREAGLHDDDMRRTGATTVAAEAIVALRRAQSRWLDASERLASILQGRRPRVPEDLGRDLTFYLSLRHARIALRVDASLRAPDPPLPAAIQAHKDAFLGHLYVDEFENRTLLELATLACLPHWSADAVMFSGDARQELRDHGSQPVARLAQALEMSVVSPAKEIEFRRQGRQTPRLAAASALLSVVGPTAAAAFPDDPGIVLVSDLGRSGWNAWTGRVLRAMRHAAGEYPIVVVVPFEADCADVLHAAHDVAKQTGGDAVLLGGGLRLGAGGPTIVVASAERPESLLGLQFDGVLLLGVDEMLGFERGQNRVYMAAARAARFLGVAAIGALPDSVAAIRQVAGEATWLS